nr:glycosyltransferase [Jannaschia sp. Os4]
MGRPTLKEAARGLDGLRLRRDPWLRGSYAEAALVLGVAPYVRERLVAAGLPPRRYETVLELGIDGVAGPRRPVGDGKVRLLHVGRGVRTKGLRDVIRAMARLNDPRLHLTSAGDGPEIAPCRAEAEAAGLGDRVRFLGLIPRGEVEALYATADAFVFPSFREPAGNVVYEAMRWGLPIVAADYGGPGAILDRSCAVMVPPSDPEAFVAGIAAGIRRIADDPVAAAEMGARARAKVEAEGLWPAKGERVAALYRSLIP